VRNLSKKALRANWRTIPKNLFTCDITKDFKLLYNNDIKKFKVISCWEVLEHIEEKDLPKLLENVVKHMDVDGVFIGSISKDSKDPLHKTLHDKSWWKFFFEQNGLSLLSDEKNPFEVLDYCRGVSGGIFDSFNYDKDPKRGFHFVAKSYTSGKSEG
jgi:hypothetical protein